MKEKIRLTQFSSGAGWACKLAPEALSQVLGNLNKITENNALIDYKSFDDAAAYNLNNETILQTVDFFTPIVDDPYDYGRIAAANKSITGISIIGPITTSMMLGGIKIPKVPPAVIVPAANLTL